MGAKQARLGALSVPGILTISDWNAARYDGFAGPRQRPAADLLARVALSGARTVTDLGCGSGLSTELLHLRWPRARVLGVDSSEAMLGAARERVPAAVFVRDDIAAFAADTDGTPEQDLIFANASLHWLADHGTLFPRLLRRLRPGGVLAVQMPDNLDEPSHRLMREVAALDAFCGRLAHLGGGRGDLAGAGDYYDLLAGDCAAVELWTTRYLHALDAIDDIVEWFRASGLKPFLDGLDDDGQRRFIEAYAARLREAYATRRDGRVLLAMPRLFIVATRR